MIKFFLVASVVVTGLVLLALLSPLGWWISLSIAAFIGVITFVCVMAAKNTAKEQAQAIDPDNPDTSWKLDVRPEKMWEPPEAFDELRGVLTSADGPYGKLREDRVLLVTRKHKIFLWSRVAIPLALALSCLVLVAAFGSIEIEASTLAPPTQSATQTTTDGQIPSVTPRSPLSPGGDSLLTTPTSAVIFWWIPLLVALASLLIAGGIWLRWKWSFFMVTIWNLYLITTPPAWLPFWQSDPDRLSYGQIDSIEVKNTVLGNVVGRAFGRDWGNVMVNSPSSGGRSFKRMKGMPDHREVVRIIESARISFAAHFYRGGG